jgi:hypothetical protein
MPPRPALMLVFVCVLALLVCASSLCLTPPGQGPFSAVHGPCSIFAAKRAAARVHSLIRTTALLAVLPAALMVWRTAVNSLTLPPSDRKPVVYILTC